MCGQGMVPTWLIVLAAPIWLPRVALDASASGIQKAASFSSSSSFSLFSKMNPTSLSQKISTISHKISLVSTTRIYGENSNYKLSQYYYKRAVYHLLMRNIADAQKDLLDSTTHYKANFRARYLRGSIFFMLGKFQQAVEAYKAATSVYDEFVETIKEHETMEQVSTTMNMLENISIKARDKLNSILSSAVISRTGTLKQAMKESTSQSQSLLEVLEVFEEQQKQTTKADVYNALGICYMNANMDDLEHATAAFNEAISLSPEGSAKRAQFALNMCICLFYDRQFQVVLNKLDELVIPVATNYIKETSEHTSTDKGFQEVCYKAFKLRGYLNSYFGNSEQSTSDYSHAAKLGSIPLKSIKRSFYYRLLPEPMMSLIIGYLPSGTRATMLRVSRHINTIAQHPSLWPVMQLKLSEAPKIPQDTKRYAQATTLEVTVEDDYCATDFFQQFSRMNSQIDTVHIIAHKVSYLGFLFQLRLLPKTVKLLSVTGIPNPYSWLSPLIEAPGLLQLDLIVDSEEEERTKEELQRIQQEQELKCQVNIRTI